MVHFVSLRERGARVSKMSEREGWWYETAKEVTASEVGGGVKDTKWQKKS